MFHIKSILYFLSGTIAGISMGMIGIGAGLITIPLLVMSGMSIQEAVGVIMVMQLLPQSAPGVLNYWEHIHWIPSLLVIIGSIVGIWIGSYLVKKKYLNEKMLYKILTIFCFMYGFYFYFGYWN
jgi:uncharacterized membrane protein YfcA